jgi:hypothetical protein
MKKMVSLLCLLAFSVSSFAQLTYTMGYEKATIEVVDKGFFSTYEFSGQSPVCGVFDIPSSTFYTCEYQTYRYVDADFVRDAEQACCTTIDFDPKKYYGTLTAKGVIEHVEWDSMVVYFKTDKARMRIEVDEREIDALYDKFFKENYLGKVHMILCLKTYDTPKENQLSYNKITEQVVKPIRTFTKILRW